MGWIILSLVGSYLLGSLPWGYVVVKLKKGVDIRKFGSGNIGATNVNRILGGKYAFLVLLLDIGKGTGGVLLGMELSRFGGVSSAFLSASSGFSSILGHCFPIFLKFRGGKGVATSAGAFLFLTPLPLLLSFGVMAGVVWFFRYVSLGSILSALSLPLFIFLLKGKTPYFFFALVLSVLIIFTHRENILRLLKGEESKLGEKIKV